MTINDSFSKMTFLIFSQTYSPPRLFRFELLQNISRLAKNETSTFVLLPVAESFFINCPCMFVISIVVGLLSEAEASIVSLSVAGFGNTSILSKALSTLSIPVFIFER